MQVKLKAKKLLLLICLGYTLNVQAMPSVRSNIALVYDETAQRTLYSKKADTVVPIASITKLMTAMVVLDAQLPLEEEISISVQDMDMLKGTHSRLRLGAVLTRGELLKLALMSSENRAAAALARTFPGGEENMIYMMNVKARELGMKNTHFLDSTGLNRRNVSTARDLVKMLSEAQHYKLIQEFTTAASHTVISPWHAPLHFRNSNSLVRGGSWDISVSKTGYIREAGRCLVMTSIITQRQVIIVLLDSSGPIARIRDANNIKKWMEGVL